MTIQPSESRRSQRHGSAGVAVIAALAIGSRSQFWRGENLAVAISELENGLPRLSFWQQDSAGAVSVRRLQSHAGTRLGTGQRRSKRRLTVPSARGGDLLRMRVGAPQQA